MKKYIGAIAAIFALPICAQGIVYNQCDADKLIVEIRDRGVNALWGNPDNPFGDPATYYVRSTIQISGGPGPTWHVKNIGKWNSQFNPLYGANNAQGQWVTLGSSTTMLNGTANPLLDPWGQARLVGGIGISSIGKKPPQNTSVQGDWKTLSEALADTTYPDEGLQLADFPSASQNLIWAVNIKQHCGYINDGLGGGATYDTHGPRWPMNQPRFAYVDAEPPGSVPLPQDHHRIGGGIAGATETHWTDQPIVVSLDFEDGGTYHRGVQVHFARSNDYYLPSENVPNHPNPWQHIDSTSQAAASNVIYSEEPIPGFSTDRTFVPGTPSQQSVVPSDVRCELFDQGDYRIVNYGVRSITVNPGVGTGKMRIELNANRQDVSGINKYKRNRYRLTNAAQFLRHPGQMFFQSKSGWLFFIPYKQPTASSRLQVLNVSLPYPYRESRTSNVRKVADAMFEFNNCRNFGLQMFQFDTMFAMGVKMRDAEKVFIDSCTFRNIGSAAVQTINLEDDFTNGQYTELAGVFGCHFYNSYKCIMDIADDRWNPLFKAGSLKYQAYACAQTSNTQYVGNVTALELPPTGVLPAWMTNTVSESFGGTTDVNHETLRSWGQIYVQAPAFDIREQQVGVRCTDNQFTNGAGIAIFPRGINGTYTGNIFTSCNRDVTDNGVIYTGRELVTQGNVVSDNVFRHAVMNYGDYENKSLYEPKAVSAVMLDDGICGYTIARNEFNNVDVGITTNAGRYHLLDRNKFNKINTRMLKMEGAIAADTGTLSYLYERAQRACGTLPFNSTLTFASTNWNWYQSSAGYGLFPGVTAHGPNFKDELDEMNGMRLAVSSTAPWPVTFPGETWLDAFGRTTPSAIPLITYKLPTEGSDIPPRKLVGWRNVFRYNQADFGQVPAAEVSRLLTFRGEMPVGFLFPMGYVARNDNFAGTPATIRWTPTGPTAEYDEFMYGFEVTTP